jgi:hypothetical protein
MGGGLVTSWIKGPAGKTFKGLVDEMVAGPGEGYLCKILNLGECQTHVRPRYDRFPVNDYISPFYPAIQRLQRLLVAEVRVLS